MNAKSKKKPSASGGKESKTTKATSRVSQTDVPRFQLSEALRVPRAIFDNYGGDPTPPLMVAKALDMAPNAGHFRNLCGSSIGYGLTEGGPRASEISLTPLALRILRPLEEGDDSRARREALLQPRVIGEFLRKYDGSPLPRDDIAHNVLENMGVPRGRAEEVYSLISEGAREVGFLEEIKDKTYVHLGSAPRDAGASGEGAGELDVSEEVSEGEEAGAPAHGDIETPSLKADDDLEWRKRRVFVTHGKDRSFLEPIKKLLGFGELEAVIATEKESVAKPVPDKVLGAMRSCGAGIIHVDAEMRLHDQKANEHVVLNPNVLIEIGAAMALYGRRFILLVREGVSLPSNLQGLYEVRYSGDTLDGNATIRLLEAIDDMKGHKLPGE